MDKPDSSVRQNKSPDLRLKEYKLVQQKFQAHLSNSPLAVIEFDPFFRVRAWSAEAEKLFGWSADEVIGKAIPEIRWVHEEDVEAVNQISADMLSNRSSRNMHANRNYRKDGSVVHCEWYNSAIYDDEGQLTSILSFILDVTERKRAEEALRESEEHLMLAMQEAAIGAWELDLNTGENVWNKGMPELLGLPEHTKVETKRWSEYVHPDDRDRVIASFKDASMKGKQWSADFRVVRADGAVRWFNTRGTFVKTSDGHLKTLGIAQDITKRKLAAEALKASEERFRALVTASSEVLFRASPDWKKMLQLRGHGLITSTENPDPNWLNKYVAYDDQPYVMTVINNAIQKKKAFEIVHKIRRVDGTVGWGSSRSVPIFDENGEIKEWFGAISDITERVRAEEALKKSEERFRVAQDMSPDGFTILHPIRDDQGRVVDFTWVYRNSAIARVTGYDTEEIKGQTVLDIFPWYNGTEFFEMFKYVAETGESRVLESMYQEKTISSPTWGRIVAVSMGEDIALLMQDITERKRAEHALKNNSERFQLTAKKFENIFLNSPAFHSLSTLKEGILLEVNPAFEALTGYSREEMIGKSAFDLRIWADKNERERMVELLRKDGVVSGREVKAEGKHPSGQIRNVLLYCNRLEIDGQDCWLTSGLDITEAKKAEHELQRTKDELEIIVQERTKQLLEANKALQEEMESRQCITEELKKSEEAYRLLVELNPVGVFRHIYDPATKTGKRLHCNEAQLKLLGYSSLHDYLQDIPADAMRYTEDWNNYISRLISEGGILNQPVQMVRKDGSIFWVLLNAVSRAAGQKIYVEGAMTDISQQKKTEQRLRSAQKNLRAMASEIVLADERSRQHFATDLHDTVVQTMGAAKLRSQLIQDNIPADIKPIFSEMQDFISQSVTQARLIMAEMSPPVLYELGFTPALEWLTEQIGSQHNMSIEFQAKNIPPLMHEIQVLLFQCTRELLMNVVKHSRAKTAVVKLSADDSRVKIEVMDDGMGFNVRQAFHTDVSGGGFGLFSIRERLKHFGGELNIRSKPGQGSKVTMTVQHIKSGSLR